MLVLPRSHSSSVMGTCLNTSVYFYAFVRLLAAKAANKGDEMMPADVL